MPGDLVRRALTAYRRAAFAHGVYHPILPTTTQEVAYAGKFYVLLRNGPALLAAYRILPNGRLKRLVRWPREVEALTAGRPRAPAPASA